MTSNARAMTTYNPNNELIKAIYLSKEVLVDYKGYRIIPVNNRFATIWASHGSGADAEFLFIAILNEHEGQEGAQCQYCYSRSAGKGGKKSADGNAHHGKASRKPSEESPEKLYQPLPRLAFREDKTG